MSFGFFINKEYFFFFDLVLYFRNKVNKFLFYRVI